MPRLLSAGLVGIVVAGGAAGWAGAGTAAPAGDPRDQPYLSVVVNQALETERTNVEIPWSNPETGHRGTIVIERTFYRDPRTPCREYRRTTEPPGERPGERPGEPATLIRGTGCRIGPAVWSLDEADAPPETATAGTSAPDVTSSGTTTSGTVPGTPAPAATGQPAPPPAGKPAPKTAVARSAPRPAPARPRAAAGPRSAEVEKAPSLPTYTLPSKTEL